MRPELGSITYFRTRRKITITLTNSWNSKIYQSEYRVKKFLRLLKPFSSTLETQTSRKTSFKKISAILSGIRSLYPIIYKMISVIYYIQNVAQNITHTSFSHCTLHSSHCTVHIAQFTLHSSHCTLARVTVLVSKIIKLQHPEMFDIK